MWRESTTMYVLLVNCVTQYLGIFQKQRSDWELIVVIDERFQIDTVLVKTDSVAIFISVLKCMQPVSSAVVD